MGIFREYAEFGWKLCGLPRAAKGPTYPHWQTDPIPADAADGLDGAGLLHALSGTAALDIDNLELATAWLAGHGIDLPALTGAKNAVRIDSGAPGRAKLLYRLKTPLRTVKPPQSGLELRCASANNTSVQDVLPPSIHPVTHKPYRWVYGEPLLGDWSALPAIPASLLALWRTLLAEVPRETSKSNGHGHGNGHGNGHSNGHGNGHASDPIDITLEKLYRWVATQDPNAPYDTWLKVGMRLHHATGGAHEGLAVWDSWSAKATRKTAAGAPVYQGPNTCRPHWLSFSNPPGKPVATLQHELPADASEFPLVEATTTEVKLRVAARAAFAAALAALEERLVYVLASEHYFDTYRHQLIGSDQALEHQFTARMPIGGKGIRISPVRALKQSTTKRTVEGLGFHPGEGALFTVGADSYANLYRNRLPKPLVPSVLELEKIEWLFARITDATYRRWLQQYFAHVVQRPTLKIRSAPLLWSETEGNGKGTLIKTLPALLVGKEYSSDAECSVLASDFNDYIIGAWHVNLAEFRAGSRGERTTISNKLKAYITDDMVTAHPKGGRAYTMPNHFFVTASSQHEDAAMIGARDRRWGVHELQAAEFTESERQWIYHQFLSTARAPGVLRHYFLHIDLQGFSADGAPPMTAAKREMADASQSADLELLTRLFEERAEFFSREVVLMSEVQDYVYRNCVAKPSSVRLGRLLTKAPFNGRALKLWAGRSIYRAIIVGNHARWESTSHKDILAYINGDEDSLDLMA